MFFFTELGVGHLTENMYEDAKYIVCRMYGEQKLESVNELRGKLFWNRLRKNGKVVDLALLPPCSSTRAHYVAKMWRTAKEPLQCLDSFQANGWLEDGSIDWIDQMFPESLEDLFTNKENNGIDEDFSEEIEFDDLSDFEEED